MTLGATPTSYSWVGVAFFNYPPNPMSLKRPLQLLMLLGLALLAPACESLSKIQPPAEEYVEADIQFYNIMGPYMRAKVEEDATAGTLTPGTAQALRQAIDNWAFMVQTAATAAGRDFAMFPEIPSASTPVPIPVPIDPIEPGND